MRKLKVMILAISLLLSLSACNQKAYDKSDAQITSSEIQSSQISVEDAKEIIEQVVSHANELAAKIYGGDFQRDYETIDGDYYLIKDYDSYKAFKEDIEKYFSTEAADKLFGTYFNDDPPLFKEVNGKLYGLDANCGYYVRWEPNTAKNITITENCIEAEMICFRLMDDLTYYKIKLIKQNENWVVNSDIDPIRDRM